MPETKRNLICTVCPIGCSIEVKMTDGKITEIKGNSCNRGLAYATAECTDPRRTLTSTVQLKGGSLPLLPVKTKEAIPKRLIFDVMKEINGVTVVAPIKIGEVILKDVAGTGVDVVATRNIEKR